MPFTSLALVVVAGLLAPDRSSKLADTYVAAVAKVNADHLARPKAKTEQDLAERLPKKATRALEDLIELEKGEEWASSLGRCARAALDLDRLQDFEHCKDAVEKLDSELAAELGNAVSRDRVLVIGEGGLNRDYLEHFADVVDDVLGAYDHVFGFAESLSKNCSGSMRIRVSGCVRGINSRPGW